jgi:hypothetical protein
MPIETNRLLTESTEKAQPAIPDSAIETAKESEKLKKLTREEVEVRLDNGQNLERFNLSGLDLAGLPLDGVSFQGSGVRGLKLDLLSFNH